MLSVVPVVSPSAAATNYKLDLVRKNKRFVQLVFGGDALVPGGRKPTGETRALDALRVEDRAGEATLLFRAPERIAAGVVDLGVQIDVFGVGGEGEIGGELVHILFGAAGFGLGLEDRTEIGQYRLGPDAFEQEELLAAGAVGDLCRQWARGVGARCLVVDSVAMREEQGAGIGRATAVD